MMLEKLREVGSKQGPDGTNDLERAALTLQMGASQRIDSESRRSLLRAIFRVENAERRYRMAHAHVDRFKNSAVAGALGVYEFEETKRAKLKAAKEIDSTTPQVSPLLVDLAEVVLLFAEFAFYYKTFSANTEKNAGITEHILIAFLATLVPVVGIMSARFFAGSVQHLRAPREPDGDGTNIRIAYVFVASLLLGTACYVTLRLVEWRFTREAAESFSEQEQLPGTVMAVVFVAFILTDALIRSFLFPPGKRTSIRRRWTARHARALDWWFLRREVDALASWQKRWFAAKALVENLKNDADQQQLSATVVILMTRGEIGGYSSRLLRSTPLKDARPRPAARLLGEPYVPHEHMAETDGYLHLPHRLIAIAQHRLEQIRPPEDPAQEQRGPQADLLRWQVEAAESEVVVFREQPDPPPPHRLFVPLKPNMASNGGAASPTAAGDATANSER
jgi:hypothetical protein